MKNSAIFLLISALLLSNVLSKAEDVNSKNILYVEECTQDDFSHGVTFCTLKCHLDLSDTGYAVDDHKFYYYSTDPSINIDLSLVYGIYIDYKYQNNQVELAATLYDSKYNAGYYVCWVKLVNVSDGRHMEQMYNFRIDANNPGLPLGSQCSTEHQCWALDAQCNVNCECGPGYTNYNGKNNTPACLPSSYSKCILDAQCQNNYGNKGYKCKNNKCRYITEDEDDNGHGLSTWSIIWIAFSLGLLFFLIIAIAITLYRRKQMKKFWEEQKAEVEAAVVMADEIYYKT